MGSIDLAKYLIDLDRIPGVSGAEEQVAAYVAQSLDGYYDELHKDSLGDHFFIKKGNHPDFKIMLSAHMEKGEVKGITGGKPAHIVTPEEAAKAIPIANLFLDLGTGSKEATVYGVASVQEEVGIRGAGPAAFHTKPDIALAIDVTLAGGTPGLEKKQIPVQLGKGPAIKFFD